MNPYVAVVVENVLPVVVTIFVPLLSVLVAWAVMKLKTKLGLDVSASQQKMLTDAIDNGIGLAEQWALGKLKRGEGAPAGAEKLDKALEFVNEQVSKFGLDAKARDGLVKLVEARLGMAAMAAPPALVAGAIVAPAVTPVVEAPAAVPPVA